MGPFDIIAIILLVIVISVVIGLNIVSVVGNKLSEVQINIPPFPKPNVIVNINKKDTEKYNVEVLENNISTITGNNTKIKETFDGNIGSIRGNLRANIKENIKEKNEEKMEENVKYLNDLDRYKKNILENPDESDVIEYEQYNCKKKKIKQNYPVATKQFYQEENTQKNDILASCPSNLNKTEGNKNLKPFGICQERQTDGQNYYKIYRAYPASLQDTKLRGYNISNFSNSAGIYEIGKINLNNNNKFAKPNNYLF